MGEINEFVEFLANYPLWVKITVITLGLAIVVILVFFRGPEKPIDDKHPTPPTAAEQEQRARESLAAILDERAKSFTLKWDSVVQALEEAGDKHSKGQIQATNSLEELKARFLDLNKKHVAAVMAGDIQYAHELTGMIYEVLENFRETVRTRNGEIGRQLYASLPRQYLDPPEPGADASYAAVQRELLALNVKTLEQAKEMDYPGPPPPSLSQESAKLGFHERTPAK
jgi:hypothetical protein